MRKIISKVAGLMLGLSLAAGVGISVVTKSHVSANAASPATLTFSAACGGSGTDSDGNTWTVTSDAAESSYDSTKGIHYGTGKLAVSYLNLSTSGISGTITNISVNASGASKTSAKLDVTVGGAAFGSQQSITSSAAEYNFTGSASGEIVVALTQSSATKALYCKSITVVYSSGGGGEEVDSLTSITVSNEKTEYLVGDEFVKPTVTATYSQSGEVDVSNSASFTGYDLSTAGNQTVTVSYTDGLTKTATYSITVTEPEPTGEVLYSADFLSLSNFSYTRNKEIELSGETWVASVAQFNSSKFYLGTNTNASYAPFGVLNNNESFADVVSVLAANDDAYSDGVSSAHAYALRFNNAYQNVGAVRMSWAGCNYGFQVYLFGDSGSGLVLLAKKSINQNDATSLTWVSDGYGVDYSSFVFVARPGATGSTATSKTIQPTIFKIYEGEAEPVDPTKKNMVIYTSGNPADGGTLLYSKNVGTHVFKAYEDETLLTDVSWSVSDVTVATINSSTGAVTTLKPGTVTIYAEAEGYNKASATVEFTKSYLEEITVTGAMTKTDYTTNDSWSHAGLTATATYHSGWTEDVSDTATWTYNPASPADGVTSVVATATIDEISGESSAQSVSVTVAHAGTADDPFTVAEGIAKAEEIGNKSGGQGPWVTTGIISDVVQVLTTGYQNARFHITEDGKTTSPSIYAYDCKYLDNAGFTEETAAYLVVGATVTITGNLFNYNNNTPEYARGCYLLDIQQPETGDVDVTFSPDSTSFEIGATGTFTASSETSGAVFTWSVDDSSVLSVNASTGAYEALALGVARVTVTASAGGKEGHTFVDFVVNGSANSYNTVSEANTIASGVTSGQTTAYYIYVEGYVKEFATSSKDGSPRAFDVMTLDEANSIMVYTNVNPYADFVSGLSLGDRIVVKGKIQNYSGKYEIVEPEKVASNASAITFAFDFISQTDAVCTGYDGVTDNGEAIGALWEGLSSSYSALYDNQKSILMGASRNESGTHVEQAVARYDYLVGKYKLDNFITGRTPVVFAQSNFVVPGQANTNSSTIVIVVVALTSITSIGVLLVIKRKRSLIK